MDAWNGGFGAFDLLKAFGFLGPKPVSLIFLWEKSDWKCMIMHLPYGLHLSFYFF